MSHDDTTELPAYSRAVGGTDPHPVTVEALIGRLDAQLDTVWAASEHRGLLTGAEAFAAAVHELVLLAQSLEGRASERVAMLRGAALAASGDEGGDIDYEDVMARLDGDR